MTNIHPRDAKQQLTALRRTILTSVDPKSGSATTFVLDALDFLSLAERALQRAADAEETFVLPLYGQAPQGF